MLIRSHCRCTHMRTRNRKVLEQIFRVNRTIRIPQPTSMLIKCVVCRNSRHGFEVSRRVHQYRWPFPSTLLHCNDWEAGSDIHTLQTTLHTATEACQASAYVHSTTSLSPRLTNTQSVKKPLRDVLHPSSDSSLTFASSSSSLIASASFLTSPSSLSSTLTLPSLTALSHSFCSL